MGEVLHYRLYRSILEGYYYDRASKVSCVEAPEWVVVCGQHGGIEVEHCHIWVRNFRTLGIPWRRSIHLESL